MTHTLAHLFSFSNSSDDQDQQIGEVCIANISPKERQKRKQFAIQQLFVTVLVLGALVWLEVDPRWRLLLFFMFSAATTSYFQALDKT
jgi:predicted nucleic acid-binding Zn ribbon protein